MNSRVSKKSKSLFFSQFVLKQISLLLKYSQTGKNEVSSNELKSETDNEVQNLSYRILAQLGSCSKLGILYHPKSLPSCLEK